MPFAQEFDDIYTDLVKAPLEESGHSVNRADDLDKTSPFSATS